MPKIVTFMWHSNDVSHYMFKAEFVTLVSLKVPSGILRVEKEIERDNVAGPPARYQLSMSGRKVLFPL